MRPIRLTRIMRQKDPKYRAAAQLLSEGKTAEGFDALDRLGWVSEMPDAEKRYAAMAADYVQARKDGLAWNDVLVVGPTHPRRTPSRRRSAPGSGRRASSTATTTSSPAWWRSMPARRERGQATTYRVGDVIQFHQNAAGHKKGERLVVTDPAEVPLADAGKFSLYRTGADRPGGGRRHPLHRHGQDARRRAYLQERDGPQRRRLHRRRQHPPR